MFKTALNKNIIPHIWKLANIVPIPKPNKDTNKGTSYRPISLLSVIAKTLEKSLLPYITANIPNTPMQHGYKTQHSTVTALHTLNNTVAKGFNQMAPHSRTITVALDMSKAFDTINIHTLIRKLLQTNIPGTIIKFIANYIKGRKAYTTYRNHTSKQRQFKTGVPQGDVLSPTQTQTTQITLQLWRSKHNKLCFFESLIFNLLIIIHLLISARQLFNFKIASNGCLHLNETYKSVISINMITNIVIP